MKEDLQIARELVRLQELHPDLPVIVINQQGTEEGHPENDRFEPYWMGSIVSVRVDTCYVDEDGERSVWKSDDDWHEYLSVYEEISEEEIAALPWREAIAVRVGLLR